jgi:hypothetical protein
MQILSPVVHLTEPVEGCGGGSVISPMPRYLWHLSKQLHGDHLKANCGHMRFAACWPFVIAAVSAECLCTHHHAVQAMMGCAWPCCMCHNLVQTFEHSQGHRTCGKSNSTPAGPMQTAPRRRICAWPGPVRHVREWEHSWPWQ